MHKYTQVLKISTLALVLSFGLSYVYAWTAPTATPPNGNVSAPINTSAASQTKAGDIAINSATHFLDTGTTIPETPAGGTGAIALNGWPNFSDVAANAVKLAGLTSADILSAQTVGGSQLQMFTNPGVTTCPTGWDVARTGVLGLANAGTAGADWLGIGVISTIGYACYGPDRTSGSAAAYGLPSTTYSLIPITPAGNAVNTSMISCAVCVR